VELILTSDDLYIGMGVCAIILVLILFIATLSWGNKEHLFLPSLILISIITAAVMLFGIYPIEQKENHDFYEDNIRDVVLSCITPDMSYYDKLVRIEDVCRIYNKIPVQKCIDYAIADIKGK